MTLVLCSGALNKFIDPDPNQTTAFEKNGYLKPYRAVTQFLGKISPHKSFSAEVRSGLKIILYYVTRIKEVIMYVRQFEYFISFDIMN